MNCPPRVEGALESVPGVADASVNYDEKTVKVAVEEGAEVKDEQLVAALKKAGFGGSVSD